jgi:hypothetical protein
VSPKSSPDVVAKTTQTPFIRSLLTREWPGTLILFTVYFGITLWIIDPVLHYYAFGPAFLETSEFFAKFPTYPGGLIEYCASYGEIWFQFALCGAFISTLTAWLVCEATRHYLKAVRGGASPYPWSLAPAFFLIAMQGWLEFPCLDTALGYFVCVASLAIYCRLPLKNAVLRLCVFVILLAAVYVLSGAMVLIVAVGAAIHEIAACKRFVLGGLTLVLGALTPWLATHFYVIHVQDAYLFKLLWNRAHPGLLVSPWLLYSSLPVSALVMAWRRHRENSTPVTALPPGSKSPAKKQSRRAGLASSFGTSLIHALQHPVTPALLLALSIPIWFDGTAKKIAQINACSRQKDWSGVLNAARNLHGWPSYAVADINRALCQQGRLLDTMFAYPQRADFALWLHFHNTMEDAKTMRSSDILFDLGQINKAERMAIESQELNGYQAATLWRLFHVYILKNEPDTARIYLNMLDLCPGEKSRAARVRVEFEKDPALSHDEELTQLRTVMLKEDYLGNQEADEILSQSLHGNPTNHMALQYLMAHFLIHQDLEYIEKNLRLFTRFKMQQLPRHIQEALLIQQKLAKDHTVQMGPWQIAPERIRDFEIFHARFMSHNGNLEAARNDLRADYGDTYWFFYMFETSGSALRKK